ncbi:MAG: hypothetical protein KF723_04045 [Rhizobiaceae bacterium]|nr:hypothetical protein [Rhizobiaceae bacterium]
MARNDKDFAPGLIVFGLDDANKPHASVFSKPDVEEAKKAASAMAMFWLAVSPGQHADVVAALPEGRLFGSGKAFVPFVTVERYDVIAKLAGKPTAAETASAATKQPGSPKNAPVSPAAAPTATPKASGQAQSVGEGPAAAFNPADLWGAVEVNQLVLAYDADAEAYYPAWVNAIKAKGILTVQFRDYVGERPIDVGIKDIGLIHPVHAKQRRR